jgi:hypothetical protein
VLHRSFDKELEQTVRENADWRTQIVTNNIAVATGSIVITRELTVKIEIGRAPLLFEEQQHQSDAG